MFVCIVEAAAVVVLCRGGVNRMSDIMIDSNLYDECRTYPNCTVEILRNSVTGKESVGWWRNDKPPVGKKKRKVRIVTVKSERDKPKESGNAGGS